MSGFFAGCKTTAYCILLSLGKVAQIQQYARENDLTEEEVICRAVDCLINGENTGDEG